MADEEMEGVAVEAGDAQGEKDRLDLSVDISDAGPCQKHLKVTVPRAEIDKFYDKEFSDLVKSASVPGFRPGKTPRKLIERRFKKDVSAQVKASLLMQSFEQVFDEEKIEPLDQPDVDVESIELPEEGDFTYEFDVEVRPDFDLPDYKSLKLQKPVKEFDEEDVDKGVERFLRQRGTMERKDGAVELGDFIVADIRFVDGSEVLREFSELTVRVDKDLYFKDGQVKGFSESMVGAKAGDTREYKVKLSDAVGDEKLQGKEVDAIFVVQQVKKLILPEINEEFLAEHGVGDEAEFRDLIKATMQYRLSYESNQKLIDQVVEKLLAEVDFELPPDLLRRQASRTLQRKVYELQSAGMDDDEVRARINEISQESMSTTSRLLKRQFVLQRIAEAEDITVEQEELEAAVADIAARTGESARRVRARVEQEQLWEGIALQVLEEKALNKVVSYSEIEEVPYTADELQSSGLDASAVPEAQPSEEEGDAEAADKSSDASE